MSNFRKIVSNGDLILQKRIGSGWFNLFNKEWADYRNLSEEQRMLKDHMDSAYMRYKELQHLFVVAQRNVQMDIDTIRLFKSENSEVEIPLNADYSILEERQGVKYTSGGNNNQQKSKGNQQQVGGNQQPQQQQQRSDQQQQQNNHQRKGGNNAPRTLMDLLFNTRVVTA